MNEKYFYMHIYISIYEYMYMNIIKYVICYVLITCLLTYLIGHNNPFNGFRPAVTHPSRCLYSWRAYANRWVSSIWSFQRIQGCPLRRLPQIPASNTRLAGVTSSIRTTWPSQCSRTLHNFQFVEELI